MVKRRFHIFLKHQIQGLFRPDSLKFKDPTWHRFRLRESFIFTVTTMRICVAYLLYILKCVFVSYHIRTPDLLTHLQGDHVSPLKANTSIDQKECPRQAEGSQRNVHM